MARISPLMIAPPLIFAGLALMLLLGMMREDPDALPSTRAGGAAPAVVVEPLADLPVFEDADLRDGEVKLLNFWASWCAPCRVEHPNLSILQAQGIPIYGVNYKDEPAKAMKFLDELGNPYAAVVADNAGRMALDWGVYGVPETYVIDGDGVIRFRFAGPITVEVLENTILPEIEKAGK